jgi:cellulose synthase/poly-beta-1,6-N-acetylglucosamine synthase-like glycosyltransferase
MNTLFFSVWLPITLGTGYFVFALFKYSYFNTFVRKSKATSHSAQRDIPGISVIIACKNEAKNIPALIEAIASVNYLEEQCEFILVDDHSTDGTAEVFYRCANIPGNVRMLSSGKKLYPAKKGALQAGISAAKFDYLLITDADCRPGEQWLKNAASAFACGDDFVIGLAPYRNEAGFTRGFFCYEQFAASLLYISAAQAGIPYSAAARNFGFRRDAFNKIGGYGATLQTIGGDDDLLLQNARRMHMRIGMIPCGANSLPVSFSPTSITEYFRQKGRHTQTSNYYSAKSLLFLLLNHAVQFFALFGILLTPWSAAFIPVLLVKVGGDILLSLQFSPEFGYHWTIWRTIFYVFMYELVLPIHYIYSLFRKDSWR